MQLYQIGNKIQYEILSADLVRNVNKFTLKKKSMMLLNFAKVDIEAQSIIKTVHNICASTLEAFKIIQ
jgi:hypothetical protein